MYLSTWSRNGFYLVLFCNLIGFIACSLQQDKNAKEDSFLSPLELPQKYGYPSELHHVVTSDGYILGIYRIPHGKQNGNSTAPRKPVLLNHGILCSSADFIITGPQNALGYVLADAGFDVWMMNGRGNTYSLNHTYLSTKSSEFWNFSFHEMGIYDITATIDYILNVTNNQKLTYIGFSQGTVSFFLTTATLPEYNSKIALNIDFAPIAFLSHSRDLPISFLFALNQPLFTALRLVGVKDYFPASAGRTKVTNAICDRGDILQPVCMKISTFVQSTSHLNKTSWIAIQGHFPAGASWKQWQHAGQIFNSGHFRQFDYGATHNKKIYGSKSPPDYDLTKVTAPTIFFEGANDLLADKKDIDHLQKLLPNLLERNLVADPKFSHFDFTWAVNAKIEVYNSVVQKINQYVN